MAAIPAPIAPKRKTAAQIANILKSLPLDDLVCASS